MEEDNTNEDIVDESAEYSPKSEYSKPSLLFEVSQRAALLRAKEMKKGYYNTSFSKDGTKHQVWIEDSRKVYCSAVTALKLLLLPEILEDAKFKNMQEDFETLFQEYAYCKIKKIGENKFVKDELDFYMPEVDAVVQIIISTPGGDIIKNIPGFWNKQIDTYWNEMVEYNDILFEQLMQVIHRKNYFKQATSWG